MTRSEVATLGLLGLAALAGASMIGAGMIRRRRRTVYTDEGAVIADPPVAEAIGEAEPDISPAETAPTMPSAWAAGSTTAASPERFVMPEGPVPLGAERDALLSRMVAAPPDEANPFRSRKARLRRARMILATRERDLKANASKPFDWRTYEPSTKRAVVPAEHQVIG